MVNFDLQGQMKTLSSTTLEDSAPMVECRPCYDVISLFFSTKQNQALKLHFF